MSKKELTRKFIEESFRSGFPNPIECDLWTKVPGQTVSGVLLESGDVTEEFVPRPRPGLEFVNDLKRFPLEVLVDMLIEDTALYYIEREILISTGYTALEMYCFGDCLDECEKQKIVEKILEETEPAPAKIPWDLFNRRGHFSLEYNLVTTKTI